MNSDKDTTTSRQDRPLISNASILILSSVVIFSAIFDSTHDQWREFVLLSGIFGLLAYIGLSHQHHRRELKQVQQKTQDTEAMMALRMSRHLTRPRDHHSANS